MKVLQITIVLIIIMILAIILNNRYSNILGTSIGRTGDNNMCIKDEDGFIVCKEGFHKLSGDTYRMSDFKKLTYAYPYYNYPQYGNYHNHPYYNYFKFHGKYYPYDVSEFND